MLFQDPSDGVYLRGGNIGSSDPAVPSMGYEMDDDDGDMVYSVTLELEPNTHYNYKFATGESFNWEGNWENVPSECGEGDYSDRYFDTNDMDMTLDPVCFGSCDNCVDEPPLPSGDPNFAVTMSASANDVSYDLTFGFSPNATDGYDSDVDQYAPPAPPPPAFDAALAWSGERFYSQIVNV